MRSFIKNILTEKWYILLLFLIGAFFRLYRISGFAQFLGDQGRDAIIVKRIVTLEHFPAIGAPSSIGQIYLGPFYYYLISPFLLLSNFDPVGLSIGVAVLSIIGTIVSFYVVKKEINTATAVIFLILITFSLPLIELARFSWNPNLLPFFSFFTLYLFYRTLKKPSYVWAGLFGAFMAFSIQLHHLAFLLAAPIVFVGGLYFWLEKTKLTQQLKYFSISFLSFLFFTSPLIVFDLRHDFLNTRNFITLLTQKNVIGESSYFVRLGETLQGLVQNVFQINSNVLSAQVLFLLFLIGVYFVFNRIRNNYLILLHLANVIFFILLFALLNSSRHLHYFGNIYVSIFFILTVLLYEYSRKKDVFRFVLPILLVILFIFLNLKEYYFFQAHSNNQIQTAKTIARSFDGRITSEKFQMISIPPTDTDGHIRYFLEIWGHKALPYESLEQPDELFAICFRPDCVVIGDPQWQIASFENKKIDQEWKSENVTIYKLVHGPKE